jgi:hypothetical protein
MVSLSTSGDFQSAASNKGIGSKESSCAGIIVARRTVAVSRLSFSGTLLKLHVCRLLLIDAGDPAFQKSIRSKRSSWPESIRSRL